MPDIANAQPVSADSTSAIRALGNAYDVDVRRLDKEQLLQLAHSAVRDFSENSREKQRQVPRFFALTNQAPFTPKENLELLSAALWMTCEALKRSCDGRHYQLLEESIAYMGACTDPGATQELKKLLRVCYDLTFLPRRDSLDSWVPRNWPSCVMSNVFEAFSRIHKNQPEIARLLHNDLWLKVFQALLKAQGGSPRHICELQKLIDASH